MAKSENKSFSSAEYARTFRRLEKQFQTLTNSVNPTKRDIYATSVTAGRMLRKVIMRRFLDGISPPNNLKIETLLPALVDENNNPKKGNWKSDEFSLYWDFAIQWLIKADITSVPDNIELPWRKWKWSEEQKKAIPITYNNKEDYIAHLQALSTMYAEACSTIAGILESKAGKKKKNGKKTASKT